MVARTLSYRETHGSLVLCVLGQLHVGRLAPLLLVPGLTVSHARAASADGHEKAPRTRDRGERYDPARELG